MKVGAIHLEDLAAVSTSRYDLWRRIAGALNVRTMVEVGVWRGEFSAQILHHCGSIDRYYMIDPWAQLPDWNKPYNRSQDEFDDVYADAMSRTAFAAKKITVLRGRTKEVIDQIPDKSLDLAYVDGDHTLRGITIDLIRLLPKMKQGGWIGGDDFAVNPWHHDARFEPTLVFPFAIHFAEAVNLPIKALPFNQFVIENCFGGSFSFTDMTGHYADLSLRKLRGADDLSADK